MVKIRFAFFFIALSVSLGCQQGERKEASTSVYETGMQSCNLITEDLSIYNVLLKETNQNANDTQIKLPATLTSARDLASVQRLLEEFETTATQLLLVGDTKVVLFPEKVSVEASLQRASKYLGDVYALRDWGNEASLVDSKEVDYAEFDTRLQRMTKDVAVIRAMGLENGSQKMETLKKTDLDKLLLSSLEIQKDILRMKTLAQRRNSWDLDTVKSFLTTADDQAGLYGKIADSSQKETERRKK